MFGKVIIVDGTMTGGALVEGIGKMTKLTQSLLVRFAKRKAM